MAVFISAGHNPKGIKIDPGAVGNGFKEADLTVEFRDLVVSELKKLNLPKVICDNESERLSNISIELKLVLEVWYWNFILMQLQVQRHQEHHQ